LSDGAGGGEERMLSKPENEDKPEGPSPDEMQREWEEKLARR
jgi:hypothetical protein